MLGKIDNTYFQLYAATIVGSSLLDLGCRIYSSNTPKHANQAKIGLAVSRALQNTSFVMPIIWTGYSVWKSFLNVNLHSTPSVTEKVSLAAFIALPVGCISYIIIGLGLNPIFALGPPRQIKDLTAHFTNPICNAFRILNITAVLISLSACKISLPSALITISACLVTMVAQAHFPEFP